LVVNLRCTVRSQTQYTPWGKI